MKRLISLWLLAISLLAQPRNGPQVYWPFVADDTSISNLALSAAATWATAGFMAASSKTVSEIHIPLASITGSVSAGDLRLAIYSDSAAKPNTEIEGINSAGAPANGWNSITGYTTSLTAGTTYWIVARNMNSTPASNYFTIGRRALSVSGYGLSINSNTGTQGGWMSASTTDSGANWSRSTNTMAAVIVFSDGTREGFPIVGAGTSCQVYSSRECGLHIRTGSTGLRVTGASAMVSRTGTPTGSARFRLYEGTGNTRTLVATSQSTTNTGTVGHTQMWFTSTVILKAWTWYTLVLSETTQSDTSTNRFNMGGYALRSEHASLFHSMLGAATKYSSTTDGGSTWTDTNDEISYVAFLLDTFLPYLTPSGGFAVSF